MVYGVIPPVTVTLRSVDWPTPMVLGDAENDDRVRAPALGTAETGEL
jgi:hypothetical protein